ncbi:RagB/SusD family nutrient uptake outer membrane protein [Aestuariibaculum sediminum]|uniref:RagB/SusD family nutrient uptake outer membrane protein n=1 Tax=Aestuariibaculum sediminum TaxID=2770637 RepID=A0A8J6Q8B6_9FLAO|nr:RagB/SusD family nutrient uptake outer membrane protein [Aestuariibaculum sediminum]MBD0832565.1 RagB/SusD family nutrient uptake outer membrane protein [Aestuariibaculum sediminum]
MKIFNIKTIILSILSIWLITSCSIDNIKPIAQLTEDNVVFDEGSANRLLNRVYNSFRESDIPLVQAGLSYWGIEQNMGSALNGTNTWPTNEDTGEAVIVRELYTAMYFAINNANYLIEAIEAGKASDLTDPRKSEILGEAKFLRAMAHFRLLRTHGQFFDKTSQYGIVVLTEPMRGAVSYARNTVQETYDAILTDLEYAANNAGSGKAHYYVSSTTARAFLAKVQLYYGDFENAATNAMAVINNTDGYDLAPDFVSIFENRWGEETLFAPYVNGPEELTLFTSSAFRNSCIPSDYFRNIADLSDGIADGTVATTGEPTSGYDFRFQYNYGADTRGPNSIGKYPLASRASGQGNTFYYARMAEVYLIYAEAEARRAGGNLTNSLNMLNAVRNRVNMPLKTLSDKATLLQDILEEKMLELFIEDAESWFDFVRYDQLGDIDISTYKSTLSDETKFILPFPDAATAGNGNLILNP